MTFDPTASEPKNAGIPDSLQRIEMVRTVHDGWKRAQNEALSLVVSLVDEIKEVDALVRTCNRNRDRPAANGFKQTRKLLEYRLRQVRSAIDAIVWTICGRQHYVVRRLRLDGADGSLDRHSLLLNLEAADDYNSSPTTCAILSDLTTFVHVGDLVIAEHDGAGHTITLAEVKSGDVNEKCHEVLDRFSASQCQRQLAYALSEMTEREQEQLSRMARQVERLNETVNTLRTDRGTDISTGKRIEIPSEVFEVEDYGDVIVEMAEELADDANWAIRDVDECLFLGLYKDRRMSAAFEAWVEGLGVASPRFAYLPMVNAVGLPCPTLAAPLPQGLRMKLFTGDYWMMMCLDIDRWMEVVNAQLSCEIQLATKRESGRNRMKRGDMIEHRGRLLKASVGEKSVFLGTGILSRILTSFDRPVSTMRPYERFASSNPVGPDDISPSNENGAE
ncbi:MAG: hypothetical protein AAF799_21865 [Myxococcota bacterium]